MLRPFAIQRGLRIPSSLCNLKNKCKVAGHVLLAGLSLQFFIGFDNTGNTLIAKEPAVKQSVVTNKSEKLVEAKKPDAAKVEYFEKHIRPALIKHCYECHSEKSKIVHGKYRVDSPSGIVKGGESGTAIERGNPDDSLLISSLKYESYEMPPKQKLPESLIAKFEKWIADGAVDPRPEDGKTITKESGIDLVEGKKFWAYQPLKMPTPPAIKNKPWGTGNIDAYIQHKHIEKGLTPSLSATPLQILRRVTFDIVGRQPTYAEIQAYLKADPDTRYANVVDNLLASEEYGLRWGRHWLDIARYADTNGADRNYFFYEAWRYRDYVIQSYREDKPFDEFIREQLAGDLLPYKSREEHTENLIATTYLNLGTKMLTERDKEKLRRDIADEQLDTISKGLLGLTITCARCHDHKFDAIPQEDYYALAGIFTSTKGLSNRIPARFVSIFYTIPLPVSEEQEQNIQLAKVKLADLNFTKNQLANIIKPLEASLKKLKADQKKLLADNDSPSDANDLKEKIAIQEKQLADHKAELKKQTSEIATYKKSMPVVPRAMGAKEHEKISDLKLAIRGEYSREGDVVPRGFLSVIDCGLDAEIPNDQSGRLELANWITSRDNPLTPRVAVNRIWQTLMGKGIVQTPENFGSLGARPTHPELLDYLAWRFIEQKWSTKSIIREIVLSKTYQMRSTNNARGLEQDLENNYLWKSNRKRLEAEQIRDAILIASGNLKSFKGGSVVTKFKDLSTPLLKADDYLTRSIYVPVIRGSLLPELEIFNMADPDVVTSKRPLTNVPAQALLMLNSPFVWNQAKSIAGKLLTADSIKTDEDRIRYVFQLLFTRNPTQSEISAAQSFLINVESALEEEDAENAELKKGMTDKTTHIWAIYCQSLLASSEFRFVD